MNILFVHETEWLDKVVFDIHTLAESLSLRGHTVYAIDYENTWRRERFPDFGGFRTRELDVSRAFEGSKVRLVRPGFLKIRGLSRVTAACTHYREIRRVVREKKINAIVLYSVPTNGLQALSAARSAGIPVLFRSIDILNQLVPVPGLRSFTRFLEKKVYRESDMILSLTPGLSDYVEALGAEREKVRLLLMPVDTGIFHPGIGSGDLRETWGFGGDDRIVLFMGTQFDFSGLDDILPLFRRVTEQVPAAKLLLVGDGPQRPLLDNLITEYNLNDTVTITGFEPYETMPQYINLADVCINTFRVTGATRDIFPGKTVQFLACGKAFIATPLPGMIAVIPGEEQGVVYAETPEKMVEAIVSLLKSPERTERLGQAGLDYVLRTHTFESIAGQLEEFIVEAIRRKKA